MTIIVYRDGVMASDSLISQGSSRFGNATKLFRSKEGWIGGCSGSLAILSAFSQWFTEEFENANDRFIPDCEISNDSKLYYNALIVRPDDVVYSMDDQGFLARVWGEYFAEGSGADIAKGAMSIGANSIRAVEAAIQWNVICGGNVQTLLLLPLIPPRSVGNNVKQIKKV